MRKEHRAFRAGVTQQEKRREDSGKTKVFLVCLSVLFLLVSCLPVCAAQGDWSLVVRPAAIVNGKRVLLGEIAEPVGNIHPQQWNKLAKTPLWAAPPRRGRAMTITRVKLRRVLQQYLGDLADLAVLPPSLALQVGGKVYLEKEVHDLVVKSLTPYLAQVEGEPKLRDVTLPKFIFMRNVRNTLELEPPTSLKPGRIGLRLREVDPAGRVVHRVVGGALLDMWVAVPAAAMPVNRHDALTPDRITHVRKNLAYLRGDVWDGKGGPWRVIRAIGTGGVIYASDIERIPMLAKGTKVTLVFKGKSIRLTVPAEALEDGKIGETISVRNLQTRKQVYAKIVSADVVEVSN